MLTSIVGPNSGPERAIVADWPGVEPCCDVGGLPQLVLGALSNEQLGEKQMV